MFDLHMHSTFSDGKDDLMTLISNVANAKIKFFSVTDHDVAESGRVILKSQEYQDKIKELGLKYVTGIEFTCKHRDKEMHILAYDFDPNNPEVIALEDEMKSLLRQKDVYRFEALNKAGYHLSQKSKDFLETRENIRKLDLANVLVEDGYFDNIEVAIKTFLNNIKYPMIYKLQAEKVIKNMSKIGAKVVWAHSIYGIGDPALPFDELEEMAAEFKSFGLSGLEAFYSLYNKDQIQKLLEIAEKLDLFVTCGSDYHGKNKKVALAELSCDGSQCDFSKIKVDKIFKNIIG